jgi:tripeptide aminopeptidase
VSSHPLDASQRERLHQTFAALCRIASPTGHERPVADWITAELSALGLRVEEDGAGPAAGADAGNLLVRIPGSGERSVMMCAHMDTVPPTAALDPVERDGAWVNRAPGILGADNKSAVAALVELARVLTAAGTPPTIGVELVFTVSEETGLRGATHFDVGRLRSEFGYVFDHASPWGEVITASPTYMRIGADIHGRAAHAGLHPEQGVSAILAAARAITAMPQGRLDAATTANVGMITGGTAPNVVPERCHVEAEVRSTDQARVDAVVTEAVDALQDAADQGACDLDLSVEKLFTGYRVAQSEPSLAIGERALRRLGYEPTRIASGGGSDANAFRVSGFACTNLANGTQYAHEPREQVTVRALDDGLAMTLALLEEAAA